MAKAGTVGVDALDNLRDAYLKMRTEKAAVRAQVREEYRQRIQDEIEARTLNIERVFAVQLVNLREQGATRKELVSVIGDGSAETMRRYIELGGGKLAGSQTGADRQEERARKIGVVRVDTNVFDWILGDTPDGYGKVTTEVNVLWQGGKPYAWPVNADALYVLRDQHGKTQADLFEKGREIADAFGLKEES